ncbi:MAG: phosphatase PAP2 family protein [Lachnospiraceae bacterium]|nr:phosphatase PAP2 family protein [Lachnospiraceae bacterium]MBO5097627.1 phosphatase PAP2 family protein [Agathobacter sp.]
MEWYLDWEFPFLYWLQSLHNPILDQIMIFITTLGDDGLFWIGIGIVCLVLKKHRREGLQVLLTMLVTFIVGNLILKNLFHRTRPFNCEDSLLDVTALIIDEPGEFSFPSGHTMNGFAAAFALFFNNKKLGIPALILAGLIAFSRMYHFVHFPTDILAGFCVGFGAAIMMNYIFDKVQAKMAEKKLQASE